MGFEQGYLGGEGGGCVFVGGMGGVGVLIVVVYSCYGGGGLWLGWEDWKWEVCWDEGAWVQRKMFMVGGLEDEGRVGVRGFLDES